MTRQDSMSKLTSPVVSRVWSRKPVVCASCGGRYRASAFDPFAFAWRVHGFPKIAAPLHVEPEIGTIAEHPGQDERGRGGDVAAVVAQLIDVLALHAHRFGQRALRQAHRLHEFFDPNFADRS